MLVRTDVADAWAVPGARPASGVGEEVRTVSLSRRQLRALRRIERDLAVSDPGLNEFFLSLAARAGGHEMPRVESVARGPFRILGRLRPRRSVTERVKGWCAENWNDP